MKDPAVLFYTKDFLVATLGMSMEERGQYITLLCYQHQNGHIKEETIRLLVGSVSVSVLDKFKKDTDGMYYNERMDSEIEKRQNFVKTRQENGLKGGRPRNKKPSGKPNGYPNGKPNGKPTENLIGNGNENGNKDEIVDEFFNKVWDEYPKKKGKSSISKSNKRELYKVGDELLRAVERYRGEVVGRDDKYIKNGDTFFRTAYKDYLDDTYVPLATSPKLSKTDESIRKFLEREKNNDW